MLKKVHSSKSLSHIQNKRCDVQCLVCKNHSSTVLYVCESGRFVCKTCRSIETDKSIQGYPKREYLLHRYATAVDILTKNDKISNERELASGDSKKIKQDYETLPPEKCNRKSEDNIRNLNFKQNRIDNYNSTDEPKFEYKNNNFKESTATIDSISMNITNYRSDKLYEQRASSSLARPVRCPVTICGKMLAIDSISQHFCFDHSKIAKITLKPRKSHRIIQKSNIFTKYTQCISIFEHRYQSKTFSSNDSFDAKINLNHFLLLCATVTLNTSKTDETKLLANGNHKETAPEKMFDNDDILMLWLCKTDNNTHSYKVTLSKPEKFLSYSFSGEPSHIRDTQNANSVYDRSNCLSLRRVAANRLLDEHNQFHIFVSIICS